MRVFVAGATGAIGTAAVRQLLSAGHHVTAMTRTPSKTSAITAAGATPVVVDALDGSALSGAVRQARPDAVIDLLTALPARGPIWYRDLRATNLLRTRGTANIIASCIDSGCRRLIAESIVYAYGFGDHGDMPLTEADPVTAPAIHPRLAPALDAVRGHELQVLAATDAGDIDGSILRFGAFYGPGAGTDLMLRALRLRAPILLAGGRGVAPWMHIDNGASAVVAALDHAQAGSIYNIADNEAASFRTFFDQLASLAGAPRPITLPTWTARAAIPYLTHMFLSRLLVSTEKAKRELQWTPQFPSFREGLAATIAHGAD